VGFPAPLFLYFENIFWDFGPETGKVFREWFLKMFHETFLQE